ncbi:hypothetical protein GCM10020001_101260 [Nonomuraea salmonea]
MLRDGDQHDAAVLGVGAALGQSLVFELRDELGHRGLRDALDHGQLGEAARAEAFEVRQRGQRGDGQVAGGTSNIRIIVLILARPAASSSSST